jgi:very-short-patch-repair endonuclease
VVRARKLRQAPTDAELKFWGLVRNRGIDGAKFVRQYPIGRYVADFVCREAMLIIEIDGGQHADSAEDAARTAFLNAHGYSVLRLWNTEVLQNPAGCWQAISASLRGEPEPGWRFSPAHRPKPH